MTRLRDATGDNSVRLSLTGRSLGSNSENLTQKSVRKVECSDYGCLAFRWLLHSNVSHFQMSSLHWPVFILFCSLFVQWSVSLPKDAFFAQRERVKL